LVLAKSYLGGDIFTFVYTHWREIKVKKYFVLCLIFILMGCTSAPTQTPFPTYTPYPTYTAYPTAKSATLTPTITASTIPSSTSTSTVTLTATDVPTATETETPLPPRLQTATVIGQTQIAKNLIYTATKEAFQARQTVVAQYKELYWKELINYPDKHTGEKVIVRGLIFNIVGDSELQMYCAGTYEAVYVKMSVPFSGLYKDNLITVYGTVNGTNCFTNTYNATICQPLIEDAFY
jgi:hypothetical protein